MQAQAGHHWAEGGEAGRERRIAEKAWQETIEEEECEPCEPGAMLSPQKKKSFDFNCTFPMMVMKSETFMKLDKMLPYEEMISRGDIFEWKPEMGGVFFLSHQWTSFSHPDPLSEQLKVAQEFLGKIGEGKIKSLFATEEEWLAFHYKETNRFLQFDPVSEEQMASDMKNGYVWLDFASVPQAADSESEEQRLRAIDSIPFYVDNALCFLAIVPKIEHKDLPGTFCTYKSWQDRGWCRLETQVHELRLFEQREGELMPGVPKMDLPRRPLIVHSGDYATTYDMMDNFYMLWQRKSSVFTGEFACCRLGHMRKDSRSGEMLPVTCDKTRIRPLVRSLWERKVYHLSTMSPVVRWMFHWRWASHADMLMSDFVEDTQQSCDPNVKTLDDMTKKYIINEEHYGTFHAIMPMFGGMFGSHPSMSVPDETEITGGGGSKIKPMLDAWFEKWLSLPLREYQVAWSVCYAVAEGNLEMLKHLHVHEKADLSLGYCWGITLLDFAAGKGHTRIINYLIEHDAYTLDKPSFRERITAIDRACKAGYDDVLDLLVAKGATLNTVRLNLQRPAHGAAIQGHTNVLKRLVELNADVTSVDDVGKAPLDYAVYYCHKEAIEFLRAAVYDGGQTAWEKKADADGDGVTTLDEIKGADDGAKHVGADAAQCAPITPSKE